MLKNDCINIQLFSMTALELNAYATVNEKSHYLAKKFDGMRWL